MSIVFWAIFPSGSGGLCLGSLLLSSWFPFLGLVLGSFLLLSVVFILVEDRRGFHRRNEGVGRIRGRGLLGFMAFGVSVGVCWDSKGDFDLLGAVLGPSFAARFVETLMKPSHTLSL